MPNQEPRNPIEAKYAPSRELQGALEALADTSPDQGEGRPDWRNTKAFRVLQRGRELGGNLLRHPVTWLGATTFGLNPALQSEVIQKSGPMYSTLDSLSHRLSSLPGGDSITHSIGTFAAGPMPFNTTELIDPSNPVLVNLALAVGSAAQVGFVVGAPLSVGYERIKANRRRERMRRGEEPLGLHEIPNTVMIGPSDLLSLIAQRQGESDQAHDPNVIIHADKGIPAAFGEQVEYHFDVSNRPSDITQAGFMRESGIDRADHLLMVAFDRDNALFYGRTATSTLTPSQFSTITALLSQQDAGRLKGRKITAVVPRDATFLTQTTPQFTLFETFRDKGVELEVITPEDVILARLNEDIALVARDKGEDEKVNICLVGGGDTDMLKTFRKALEENPRAAVSVVSDDVLGEAEGQGLESLSDAEKSAKMSELLANSDINYVYGDTDSQTTDLGKLAIARGAQAGSTVCILEREESTVDAAALRLNNLCVYTELADMIGGQESFQPGETIDLATQIGDPAEIDASN